MSASRPSRVTAGLLLGMALLLLFAVAVAACGGGDDFEGTWVQEGEEGAMVIKAADDGYDVTIKAKESDESGMTLKATEDGGTLTIKDPTGATDESITMTVDGDKMTVKSGEETTVLMRK